jgi:protein SCO1/2
LKFTDAEGTPTQLSDVLGSRRPVMLTLNYSDCPMLCNLQLDALVEGLKGVAWTAGEQYDILTVSINPSEKLERTRATRDKYVEAYGRPSAKQGWHFWTGTQENIQALARTVGFKYQFVEARQEYAHTAAVMLLSPDGQVTRYLYGVVYNPADLRLALVEAGEGKIGSTVDRILLYCFHYDASAGRYAPVAANIMRLGGFVTVIVLASVLGMYWLNETKKTRRVPFA